MSLKYVSQLFQPIITIPKNAKIKHTEITCRSQKLLLECGLIRPTSSGLFTLLPLARRSLDKLEKLIVEVLEDVGGQRVTFPTLTSAALWEKTGRLEGGGAELMKLEDRHGKKYLLSPTHEEAVADLLADVGPLSYKQLPLLIYQIGNKYRDEFRPKHGVLRAREFCMMDAYGAHAGPACAADTYERVSRAYSRLFRALRLPVHRVAAPPGAMGGALSHEWQARAAAGEDALELCAACSHAALPATPPAPAPAPCARCGGRVQLHSSIEVGHTFVLDTRYSEPLRALFTPPHGPPAPLVMSCYGIGVTRLLAACVEALSSEGALRWPPPVAPYALLLVGPKEGSAEWARGSELARAAAQRLARAAGDVLVDDRHHLTIGKRLVMAERMGYPYTVVCGKAALEHPSRYEVYTPGDAQPRLLTLDQLEHLLQTAHREILVDNI